MNFDKNKKFLFVFDLDGTLLSHYWGIHQDNSKIIHLLAQKYSKNFFLAFASGRDLSSMQILWDKYYKTITSQFHIALNGAYLVSIMDNNINEIHYFYMKWSQDFIKILVDVFSYSFDIVSRKSHLRILPSDNGNYEKKISTWLKNGNTMGKIIGIMSCSMDSPPFKKLMSLQENGVLNVHVHAEYGNFIEITKAGTDKYMGTIKLAKLLGIGYSNIVAIGNGPNDYTMIKGIENSYLVSSHSLVQVPQHTKVLNMSNEEGFLIEIVKNLNLL